MPSGDGTVPTGSGRGIGHGMGLGQAKNRGRMGGLFTAGPGGSCICPNCAAVVPHGAGQPCNARSCPRCGTKMTRA